MRTMLTFVAMFGLLILVTDCQNQHPVDESRPAIDSLSNLVNLLKPGLGEFMIQIKYHHDELGKAITAKDFERVAYEVDEINEITDKLKQSLITNEKLRKPFSFFYDKYLE